LKGGEDYEGCVLVITIRHHAAATEDQEDQARQRGKVKLDAGKANRPATFLSRTGPTATLGRFGGPEYPANPERGVAAQAASNRLYCTNL
jgi:hypothetical protein